MSANTVERMIEWIEDNLTESPMLPQMASYVGYSEYHCSTKLHEYTGLTFKEYIVRRRLTAAAETPRSADSRIIDIAFDFGFSSSGAFSSAFCSSPVNNRLKD